MRACVCPCRCAYLCVCVCASSFWRIVNRRQPFARVPASLLSSFSFFPGLGLTFSRIWSLRLRVRSAQRGMHNSSSRDKSFALSGAGFVGASQPNLRRKVRWRSVFFLRLFLYGRSRFKCKVPCSGEVLLLISLLLGVSREFIRWNGMNGKLSRWVYL